MPQSGDVVNHAFDDLGDGQVGGVDDSGRTVLEERFPLARIHCVASAEVFTDGVQGHVLAVGGHFLKAAFGAARQRGFKDELYVGVGEDHAALVAAFGDKGAEALADTALLGDEQRPDRGHAGDAGGGGADRQGADGLAYVAAVDADSGMGRSAVQLQGQGGGERLNRFFVG